MNDRIRSAFGDVRADDALLNRTAAYLQKERARRNRKQHRIRRMTAAIAALLVLVVGIFGYEVYYDAVAYVSIDVNPSMELTLNRLDKVIGMAAYNLDGEALLRQVDVKGKSYDEAVVLLLDEIESQGYLSSEAIVTMTVQTANHAKEQALCEALLLSAGGQTNSEQPSAEVEVFPVTQEVRQTARECHMSAAKYLAIQRLMEVDETATLEAYSESTIQQIRQRTQECREEHGNGDPSDNEHNGNGHGQGNRQDQEPAPSVDHDGQSDHQGKGNGQNQGGGHGNGNQHGNKHGD